MKANSTSVFIVYLIGLSDEGFITVSKKYTSKNTAPYLSVTFCTNYRC